MSFETTTTSILILLGACIMGASLLSTRKIFALVAGGRLAGKWRALFFLMLFFLVGYLACLALSLAGAARVLTLLTGVIFLSGAAFVNLVVHLGRQTIHDLLETTVSRAQFEKTIETMADALLVLSPDLRIRMANHAAAELCGCESQNLIGQPAALVFDNCDLFECPDELLRDGPPGHLEKSCRAKDGRDRTVAFSWSLMRGPNGGTEGVVCLVRDISERKRSEMALRRSEERYALAALGANDGLWDWDLRSNRIYFSPRWKSMVGYEESEIGDSPEEWLGRVHPEDRPGLEQAIGEHLDGETPHVEVEHRIEHRDGSHRWTLVRGVAVRDENGSSYRFAGSQSDITDRKRFEDRLLHSATHDVLTGLPNRALLEDRLDRALQKAKRRDGYKFAMLFVDIDRFKSINDSLGHSVGDELIGVVARTLPRFVRGSDTVGRLGGDEFVVLLEDISDVSDAIRVADRIYQEFGSPVKVADHDLLVRTSTGIVLSETGYECTEHVLRDADIAMYRAKSRGGNRYEVFDEDMRERMTSRLELESALRRALAEDELEVYYQPIVHLDSGAVAALEALVRWNHPQRGLVSPAVFVPLAEETGQIVEIDRWVLREACRQTREWNDQLPAEEALTLSVNMSTKQFLQPEFVPFVTQVLLETGLAPTSLTLEITESTLIENVDTIPATLEQLRGRGVRISIDDFGTGYSSLSYLHHLPIDMLKIDREFVRNIGESGTDLAIVHTVLLLVQALEIRAVAEGVETELQRGQLRDLDCDFGQGYLFSRPLPAAEVQGMIAGLRGSQPDPEQLVAAARS